MMRGCLLLVTLFASVSLAGEAEWKALHDKVVPQLMSGDVKQAEKLAREAVAEAEKAFGANHLNTAASQGNLALALRYQKRYDESEKVYRQALATRVKLQGTAHPSTALMMLNMADVVQSLGRLPDAEKLQREALAVFEKILGDDTRTATALNNLGANMQLQRRYKEAELVLRRSLAMKEKVLGSISPSVAHTLNNLAEVCDHLGRKDEAAAYRKRAEEIRRQVTEKA